MYQQREEPDVEVVPARGPWRPEVEGAGAALVPQEGDRYVVVDDVEAGRVVLVIDGWPVVDGAGHLVFTGRAAIRDVTVARFQGAVDAQRAQAGQPAAGRPLRVGDVFWVRPGQDGRFERPQQWQVLDVTAAARRAARAAQLVAVNPALRSTGHAGGPESPTPGTRGGPLRPPPGATAATV